MTGGYPAPRRPRDISPPPGPRESPTPNNTGTPLMTRDRACERPGDPLSQMYLGGRATGCTRRGLPAASARPAALPSYCFSPIKMAAAASSPAPPRLAPGAPSLLARPGSPARGLGSAKSAVARAPGSRQRLPGGAGHGAGHGAGPEMLRASLAFQRAGWPGRLGGWLGGQMGFGFVGAMTDPWVNAWLNH